MLPVVESVKPDPGDPRSLQYELVIVAGIFAFFLVAFVVMVVLLSLLMCQRRAATKYDEEKSFAVVNPQFQKQQSTLTYADEEKTGASTGFVWRRSSLEFPRKSLELGHIVGK